MIPTILITGFLGAGKTTLLNRLIEYYRDRWTVLLINEFGKVGIDGELLLDGDYEKVELNKGSLFCICVRTDFIAEVERIARQLKPDLLIIEATGLADTSEMENMLALPHLKNHIQLKACLCLVDSQNFLKIKDNLRAPVSQIRSADLVIVNKIDLVPEEQVAAIIRAVKDITDAIPIITTSFADFPLEKLDELAHPQAPTTAEPGEGRPDPLASITLEGRGNFTKESWTRFTSSFTENLYRLKGFVFVDGQSYYVDATTDRWTMMPATTQPPATNRLVLIGRKLDEQHIEERFIKLIS